MISSIRPARVVALSSNADPERPARVARDTEKLKSAIRRLRTTSKEKRDRLSRELQNSVNAIDRLAREEIDFLKSIFDSTDVEDLDDDIIFHDEN